MLQEVEQCASLLTRKNSQEIRTQDLIKLWEQRYQATQVLKAFCKLLIKAVKYLYQILLWFTVLKLFEYFYFRFSILETQVLAGLLKFTNCHAASM